MIYLAAADSQASTPEPAGQPPTINPLT